MRKSKISIFLIAALFLSANSFASTYVVDGATEVVLPGPTDEPLRNIYSPAIFGDYMYLGGWLNEGDRVEPIEGMSGHVGADKLYRSKQNSAGTWSRPVPLHFINEGFKPGKIKGYHANDPSLIQPPSTAGQIRSGWIYLYFTCLPSQYANDPTKNNHVCLATSTGNGDDWNFLGEVIGQNNGSNNYGAWSPSAVVVKDEVQIFYHDSTGAMHRTRLNANGISKLGGTDNLTANGSPLYVLNPDVVYKDGLYILVGDRAGAETMNDIVIYKFTDGIKWTPYAKDDSILIHAGNTKLITPHLASFDKEKSSFEIYMAMQGVLAETACPAGWHFPGVPELNCTTTTLHHWKLKVDSSTSDSTDTKINTDIGASPRFKSATLNTDDDLVNRDYYRKAFLSAFNNLMQAHRSEASPDDLKPLIDVCSATQKKAHDMGVEDTDRYICR